MGQPGGVGTRLLSQVVWESEKVRKVLCTPCHVTQGLILCSVLSLWHAAGLGHMGWGGIGGPGLLEGDVGWAGSWSESRPELLRGC